jgi:hypothetical protein
MMSELGGYGPTQADQQANRKNAIEFRGSNQRLISFVADHGSKL